MLNRNLLYTVVCTLLDSSEIDINFSRYPDKNSDSEMPLLRTMLVSSRGHCNIYYRNRKWLGVFHIQCTLYNSKPNKPRKLGRIIPKLGCRENELTITDTVPKRFRWTIMGVPRVNCLKKCFKQLESVGN